ncbi:MAG: ribonuclease P protein subunit [Candidatus Aenigmatarchaeota archaeon]
MRTPENILMHEFIGLECTVVSSTNKCHIGIKGKIVDETKNMLILETREKVYKKIPKRGAVFRLRLDKNVVEIKGDTIISRPENRIKKRFNKW